MLSRLKNSLMLIKRCVDKNKIGSAVEIKKLKDFIENWKCYQD